MRTTSSGNSCTVQSKGGLQWSQQQSDDKSRPGAHHLLGEQLQCMPGWDNVGVGCRADHVGCEHAPTERDPHFHWTQTELDERYMQLPPASTPTSAHLHSPGLAAKGVAKLGGDGLHGVRVVVGHRGQGAADALNHGDGLWGRGSEDGSSRVKGAGRG